MRLNQVFNMANQKLFSNSDNYHFSIFSNSDLDLNRTPIKINSKLALHISYIHTNSHQYPSILTEVIGWKPIFYF